MPPATRRQLLAQGAALAGAAGLAVAAPAAQAAAAKPVPSDGALISLLAGVELLVAYVYDRALASGELAAAFIPLAETIVGHERAHARTLSAELPALGGPAPSSPANDREAEQALMTHHTKVDLAASRTSDAWVKLLFDVEQVLERNYHQAISELRRPALIRLCAEILASEGQHAFLLEWMRYPTKIEKALRSPFVNGD